ncbi:MAG TPA: hypothetical protein VGP84_23285 [Gemmatimonadaceae bacterium]|nr:hypothetical protein [Gemmatimonadaceae bacterium]
MRHGVTEDERVDVRCSEFVAHDASKAIGEQAERARLVVRELTETADMTLRFDNQPAPISDTATHRVDMTYVEEFVLEENSAFRKIAESVLVADEAVILRVLISAIRHRARLPDRALSCERGSADMAASGSHRLWSLSRFPGSTGQCGDLLGDPR